MSNLSNLSEVFTASYIFGLGFTSLFMGTVLTFLDEIFVNRNEAEVKDNKSLDKKDGFVPGKMGKKKLAKTWAVYTFLWFVLNLILDIIFSLV